MKFKNFCFAQNDKNFLYENYLLVILYTVNIWCTFDMNENIVTQKFLTQNFANKINVNYSIAFQCTHISHLLYTTLFFLASFLTGHGSQSVTNFFSRMGSYSAGIPEVKVMMRARSLLS